MYTQKVGVAILAIARMAVFRKQEGTEGKRVFTAFLISSMVVACLLFGILPWSVICTLSRLLVGKMKEVALDMHVSQQQVPLTTESALALRL